MGKNKKILSLFLIIIFSISFNTTAYSAVNNKPTEHLANVVFFVNFSDTAEDFTENNFKDIKILFDGKKPNSLTNYINNISYGQMNVHNYYPQEINGIIIPYTLSKPKAYYKYSNEYEMLSEIITSVSVDLNYNIDMNNDGYVDNIIFIFNGATSQENDVIWPHKASLIGGPSINNVKVNNYNVQNTESLIGSLISGGEGVLAHEFLHSVGYPDLYRSSGSGNPVGRWDVMASVSIFLQYPLAYLRSTISDWITIDSITENGTYTLNPASSKEGNQAFILKTPMSDKEFFVVEYRKQTNFMNYEIDSKIPGSGLIIYRVNTEQTSNYGTSKDYIYVFRPGETAEGEGNGNVSEAFLSKESGRTSYGSDDLSAKVSDKAITYSSGQNSGIVIENVSEAGDNITFDVKFTDTKSLGIWDTVGGQAITTQSADNIGMDVVGNKIYTVYSEGSYYNKVLKAKVFDGNKWTSLGANILNEFGYNAKIKVYNDEPYVIYNDKNYKAIVARFRNNNWEKLAVLSTNSSQYTDMTADDSGLYITYTELNETALKVARFNVDTNSFEQVGDTINSGYVANPSITSYNGELYVSYTNFKENSKVYVRKYENNKWQDTNIGLTASYTNIKANENGVYIGVIPVVGQKETNVYVYNGSTWSKVGESIGGAEVSSLKMSLNAGVPYAAYIDNNNGDVVVKYFDGTKWNKEGSSVSDEATNEIEFSIIKGKAYVGVNVYNSQNFIIKAKSLQSEIIEDQSNLEDINKDGVVDLLDLAIISKKYNLTNTDEGYLIECDFNNDGIIDIFDIIMVSSKL